MISTRTRRFAAILALSALGVVATGSAGAAEFKFFKGDHDSYGPTYGVGTVGVAADKLATCPITEVGCNDGGDLFSNLNGSADGSAGGSFVYKVDGLGAWLHVTAKNNAGTSGIVIQDLSPDFGGLGVYDDYNDNITNAEQLILTFRSGSGATSSVVNVELRSLVLFDHNHTTNSGQGNSNNNWSYASDEFLLNGNTYALPYDTCDSDLGHDNRMDGADEIVCGGVDLVDAGTMKGLIGSEFVFATKDPHPDPNDQTCYGDQHCSGWDNEWSYYVNALNVVAAGPPPPTGDTGAPEPGTLLMLAAGLVGVGLRRRKAVPDAA